MRRLPPGMPWAWARKRVLPVIELAEPTSSIGDPHVTVSGPFGMRIGFGIDLRDVLVRVPQSLVDRWGLPIHALEDEALANLRWLAADLGPGDLQEIEHEGTHARFLTVPSGNASSLILIPKELHRVLGLGRHTLVTVSRGLLLALPFEAPLKVVWDYMSVITYLDPTPLQEGPFAFEDGRLEEWIPPPERRVRRIKRPTSRRSGSR